MLTEENEKSTIHLSQSFLDTSMNMVNSERNALNSSVQSKQKQEVVGLPRLPQPNAQKPLVERLRFYQKLE